MVASAEEKFTVAWVIEELVRDVCATAELLPGSLWPCDEHRPCDEDDECGGCGYDASGNIHAPDCLSNEGLFNDCFDISGKTGPKMQLTHCYDAPNDHFTVGEIGISLCTSLFLFSVSLDRKSVV